MADWEFANLIGQTRQWPTRWSDRIADVTCIKVTGDSVITATGIKTEYTQVWCTFTDRRGEECTVWFIPDQFMEMIRVEK